METQIIIDTRERKDFTQTLYWADNADRIHTCPLKLNFGDYSNVDSTRIVERKGLGDAVSTVIGKNYLRFIKEMERAKEAQEAAAATEFPLTFLIVIEASQKSIYGYMKRRHLKIPPLHIIHQYDRITETYGFPVIWAGGREEAAAVTLEFLTAADNSVPTFQTN